MNKKKLNIKNTGFKVPENYFETFEDSVLHNIKLNSQLNDLKNTGFKVPENYFESFDENVFKNLNTNKSSKVVNLFNRKKASYITGIAASIILVFNLFFNNKQEVTFSDIETANIEAYLTNQNLSSYQLGTILEEESLVIDNFIDNKINKESLEDYLLENTTLEELIIE